MAANDIKT